MSTFRKEMQGETGPPRELLGTSVIVGFINAVGVPKGGQAPPTTPMEEGAPRNILGIALAVEGLMELVRRRVGGDELAALLPHVVLRFPALSSPLSEAEGFGSIMLLAPGILSSNISAVFKNQEPILLACPKESCPPLSLTMAAFRSCSRISAAAEDSST